MQVLIGIFGLGIGALINFLADSLPHYKRPGRAECRSCTAPRPITAWTGLGALLSGQWRCAYCDTPLLWRLPFVEFSTIVGILWLYNHDPLPAAFWPGVLVGAVFLLVIAIDMEHRLILHIVSVPAAIIFALINIFKPDIGWARTLGGGLAGFGISFILFLLGEVFARLMARRRGQPIGEVAYGFGDVTLATVIGLLVAWPGVLLALFIGVLIAGEFSIVYIVSMLIRREYQAFMPIPYGPFLVLGAWLVYYGGRPAVEAFFPNGPLILLGALVVLFSLYYALKRVLAR
jgi:leader peptidase (prepilin peptidase)/N-methyltransferase